MSSRSRRRFDDDDQSFDLPIDTNTTPSTYPDAVHGPEPRPDWVITSGHAVDTDVGVFKTGKEADVSLVRREFDGQSVLLAAKRYRDSEHRMFHRDAGYLEGRRVRRSRETRAMAARTDFGRQLLTGQWSHAEFNMLSRLWVAGAAVPYPVQMTGTEILMEFVGDADGYAAPRLAQLRPTPSEAWVLYEQLREVLGHLAEVGYTHGDLSPYNVLVDEGRLVMIDLPQAIDLAGNPQGRDYLRRDCRNICSWFVARDIEADADALCDELLNRFIRRA